MATKVFTEFVRLRLFICVCVFERLPCTPFFSARFNWILCTHMTSPRTKMKFIKKTTNKAKSEFWLQLYARESMMPVPTCTEWRRTSSLLCAWIKTKLHHLVVFTIGSHQSNTAFYIFFVQSIHSNDSHETPLWVCLLLREWDKEFDKIKA